jgi:hypothetical protein
LIISSLNAQRHHLPPIQSCQYRFEPNGGSRLSPVFRDGLARTPFEKQVEHDAQENGAQAGGVGEVAGYSFQSRHSPAFQLTGQVTEGIGELGKNQDFVMRVNLRPEPEEGRELGIFTRVPLTALARDLNQGLGIGEQVLLEGAYKKRGAEPFEPAFELRGEVGIDFSGPTVKILRAS